MATFQLGITDLSISPLLRQVVDFVGRVFEVWELLLVLDRRQVHTKQHKGSSFILSALDGETFFLRIVPPEGDMIKVHFPAGKIIKLRRIMEVRRTATRRR